MLFPRSYVPTRPQKWAMVVLGLLFFSAIVYCYERYYRGPSESALLGTWQVPGSYEDEIFYYQFNADHTLSVSIRHANKMTFITKGRWYAGGKFLYLRWPAGFHSDGRLVEFWHIDDISPQEIRLRYWRDGMTHIFHRVDSVATRASNRTIQRTATRRVPALSMTRILSIQMALAPSSRH